MQVRRQGLNLLSPAVRVQWPPRRRHHGLAQCFALHGVSAHDTSDLRRKCFPRNREFSLRRSLPRDFADGIATVRGERMVVCAYESSTASAARVSQDDMDTETALEIRGHSRTRFRYECRCFAFRWSAVVAVERLLQSGIFSMTIALHVNPAPALRKRYNPSASSMVPSPIASARLQMMSPAPRCPVCAP
ncbi:hypothetical protein RhoFasSB10_04343 [Rhodococcus fascians]|nr:hypothetical protein [Rhodococcus fascians]